MGSNNHHVTDGDHPVFRIPKKRRAVPRCRVIVDLHLVLRQGNDVLLARRYNTGFADGLLHMPAGHLEEGETVVQGMIREAREELDISIEPSDIRLVQVMHQVTEFDRLKLFFECWFWTGIPRNAEPDKCSELRWCNLAQLPDDMVQYGRDALVEYALSGTLLQA